MLNKISKTAPWFSCVTATHFNRWCCTWRFRS